MRFNVVLLSFNKVENPSFVSLQIEMPGILFQFLATAFEVSSYNVLRAILRALRNENNSTQDYDHVHSPLAKFTSTDHPNKLHQQVQVINSNI